MSIDGTVGAKGQGEITAILSLAGVEVTLSAPLLCKSHKSCAEGTEIEVSPEKLPWTTAVGVSNSGTYLEIVSEPTFSVTCLVLGVKVSDECVGSQSSAEVLNVAGGVEPMGQELPKANCSIGGAETGSVEFVSGSLTTLTGGGTLSVSGEFVKPLYEGEGPEKEILEGEWKEEEAGAHQYFTFNNAVPAQSVICQLAFTWTKQAASSVFIVNPAYAGCFYSGNGEKAAVTFGATCRYRFKAAMMIARGFRATLDLIGTGCEVKITFENTMCQIKIPGGGTNNQNLPWVYETNSGANLDIDAAFNMTYTAANCAAVIGAGGSTAYSGGMIAFGAKI